LVSLAGYLYVFASLGLQFILFGMLTLLIGVGVYLLAARKQGEWPFERVDYRSPGRTLTSSEVP
jgi:hypothetical protein